MMMMISSFSRKRRLPPSVLRYQRPSTTRTTTKVYYSMISSWCRKLYSTKYPTALMMKKMMMTISQGDRINNIPWFMPRSTKRHSTLVSAGGGRGAGVPRTASTAMITNTPASRLSRDSFRQLEDWTNEFLHPVKTPLGTLSLRQWQVALTAVQAWLGTTGGGEGLQRSVVARVVPRYVDTAGRVLDRLLFESHSKGAPDVLQKMLEPSVRQTILAWLEVSEQQQQSSGGAAWGLRQAERWCDTLEGASWQRSVETERQALLRIKQQVIAIEIEQQTMIHAEALCRSAAEQLLTYADDHPLLSSLDASFRTAVHQTLQVAVLVQKSELNEIVSALLQRMDDLAERDVLTRIPPDELDKIIDSLYMEGRSAESSTNKLSAYEKKALHRRILTKIAAMEDSDDRAADEAVDELIRNWRTNVQSKDIAEWKPFAEVVTNFYLRIRDAYKATKWMQIQEQIPTPEQWQEALDIKSERRTDSQDVDDINTEFQELKALETIFSQNQNERVRQKLNLLNIWAERVHSRITPWRVTEILESLEAEEVVDGTVLTVETYLTVVRLWVKEESQVSNQHHRKAIAVAMRCPQFTHELLTEVCELLLRQNEQDKGSAAASAIKLVDKFEEVFDTMDVDNVVPLAESLATLMVGTVRLQDFVAFLIDHKVQLTERIAKSALSSLHNESSDEVAVYKLLAMLDQLPGANAATYHAAIEWLLRRKDNAGFAQAANMLPKLFELDSDRAVTTLSLLFHRSRRQDEEAVYNLINRLEQLPGGKTVAAHHATIDWLLSRDDHTGFAKAAVMLPKLFELESDHAVDTLITMFDRARRRQLSTALQFLDAIEADVLAPCPPPAEASNLDGQVVVEQRKESPIPLSFYKRFLSWAEDNPQHFVSLTERLHRHHDNGWLNLHPDAEMSRKLMFTLYQEYRRTHTGSTTDQRVEILERLIQRYEKTGRTEAEYKPLYIMFDWVIGDLKDRNKSTRVNPASTVDLFEKDSRKAVMLLEKMHTYGIAPANADRPYVFNAAMEMILSCRNTHMHFKTIMILKRQMSDLGIQPNVHTVIDQLRACERASAVRPKTRKAYWAWHSMLIALNEARRLGAANKLIYNLCFRVMQANREMKYPKTHKRDEMLEKVTYAAIADDAFGGTSRRIFFDLASDALKRRFYELLARRTRAAAKGRPGSTNQQQQQQ